jgi:FAD/FMN-containing dehydrogenase
LHGGFGFSSHAYGLAVDWIVGATVVLANSTVVNASATENPDLFWAIRGAGSCFGIVAEFRFNTFAAPSTTTVFQANLNWGSASQAVSQWQALQTFVQNSMPREMNMRIFLSGGGPQLQGLYHGTQSALQSAIQPLMSSMGASLASTSQTNWMGGFTGYSNGQNLESTAPYNEVRIYPVKLCLYKSSY